MVRTEEKMLDGHRQRADLPYQTELFTTASCRKDWKISAESSLMSPQTAHSVKRLNELSCGVPVSVESSLHLLGVISKDCLRSEPVGDYYGQPVGDYRGQTPGNRSAVNL